MSETKGARIRELNDQFRKTWQGDRVVYTMGVNGLPTEVKSKLLIGVKNFDDFKAGNNPYGEHDFGSIEINGQSFFFKIDYYGTTMDVGSEDPSDPAQTTRVMTIMLAEEY